MAAGMTKTQLVRHLAERTELNNKTAAAFLENLADTAIKETKKSGVFDCRIGDRKSTRLNSSHEWISYAVFCLKKKNAEAARFATAQVDYIYEQPPEELFNSLLP